MKIKGFGLSAFFGVNFNFNVNFIDNIQHKRTGPLIAFANLGGTVTLKDYNENNK